MANLPLLKQPAISQLPDVYLDAIVIMGAAMDGIAITEMDGKFSYVNPAFAKLYGYSEEELIGVSWERLCEESGIKKYICEISPIFEREKKWRGETEGKRKDGTTFPQEVSLTATDGARKTVVRIVRDISRRREREFRQSFLSDIVSALAESIDYESTLKKAAHLAVPLFANWCVITLLNPEGLIERVIVGTPPDQAPMIPLLSELPYRISAEYCHKKVIKTRDQEYVAAVTDKFRETFWPNPEDRARFEPLDIDSYICTPLNVRDKFLGAIGFFRTRAGKAATYSKEFNSEDLQLAKSIASRMALAVDNAQLYRQAQEAIRARDDLMATVSHDLRNPLSAIAVTADMLNRVSAKQAKEVVLKKLAGAIKNSVERMSVLIRELLDLEKIRLGAPILNRKKVCSKELIGSVVSMFQPLAEQKAIQITTAPDDFYFSADRDRILQVFSNLIGNAIKFTPVNGKIDLFAEQRKNEVLFKVQDTGWGIEERDIPHIFDRYYQSQESMRHGQTRGVEGSPSQVTTSSLGLGLAIARAVVEAHGGSIWVESKLFVGSVFSFTIPV